MPATGIYLPGLGARRDDKLGMAAVHKEWSN